MFKTFKTSLKAANPTPAKSLLLFVICFTFFQPAVRAQRLNLDQRILISIMENRTPGGERFFKGVSNSTHLVTALIPVSVVAAGLVSNDKPILVKGLYMTASVATSCLVTQALKQSFDRRRPYIKHPGIVPVGGGSSSPSFPSGHTSAAFSAATSLTIAFPKWYVAVPAYTWAATVGYSRMYLGVHYPSDVLAGAVIGAGSAWLMHKANKWLFGKQEPKGKLF